MIHINRFLFNHSPGSKFFTPINNILIKIINVPDPLCVEKKGQCIPRAMCTGKVLYISRSCYHRDYVCCYDDAIKFPTVGRSDSIENTSTVDY